MKKKKKTTLSSVLIYYKTHLDFRNIKNVKQTETKPNQGMLRNMGFFPIPFLQNHYVAGLVVRSILLREAQRG